MPNTYKLKRPPVDTPRIYETEEIEGDCKLVTAHYFLPGTCWDYYVIEYDSESDEMYCWGEVLPGCGEYGYTRISDLEEVEMPVKIRINNMIVGTLNSRVEYDEHWTPRSISEVLEARNR